MKRSKTKTTILTNLVSNIKYYFHGIGRILKPFIWHLQCLGNQLAWESPNISVMKFTALSNLTPRIPNFQNQILGKTKPIFFTI